MKYYGYVINIEDTPDDNVWTDNREIELSDDTIVYGCEGDTLIGADLVTTSTYFRSWLESNSKTDDDIEI